MKVMVLVEDRDTAYCILDASAGRLLGDAVAMELKTDGVDFCDIENEDYAVWLEGPDPATWTVVKRDTIDFESADFDKIGYPIPTPVVLLDEAEYNRRLAE